MKASELGTIVGPERPKAPIPKPDPFGDLPDAILTDLRAILGPVQDAGLPMEIDPLIPMSVGVAVEGILFRVVVVSDRSGTPQRVEILGPPNLTPWPKEDLLNLLPEARINLTPPLRINWHVAPERRHATDVLEDVLAELREIKARLP